MVANIVASRAVNTQTELPREKQSGCTAEKVNKGRALDQTRSQSLTP